LLWETSHTRPFAKRGGIHHQGEGMVLLDGQKGKGGRNAYQRKEPKFIGGQKKTTQNNGQDAAVVIIEANHVCLLRWGEDFNCRAMGEEGGITQEEKETTPQRHGLLRTENIRDLEKKNQKSNFTSHIEKQEEKENENQQTGGGVVVLDSKKKEKTVGVLKKVVFLKQTWSNPPGGFALPGRDITRQKTDY